MLRNVFWVFTSFARNLERNLTRYFRKRFKNGVRLLGIQINLLLFCRISVSFSSKRSFSLQFTVQFDTANSFFLSLSRVSIRWMLWFLAFKFLSLAFLVFKVKVFFAKSRIAILQVVCESLYQEHNKLISAFLFSRNAKRVHSEYAPYQRPSCIRF
jgi:hypothetical protein